MLVLGIETSCDETAVSLLEVRRGRIRILSNAISSQVKLHAKYGGVFPSLAAREHVKNLPHVLKLALQTTNHKLQTIDLIAVTRGPGLISSLLVGTTFAKTLAWKYKKPIVGVNHLEGHIASNWLKPIGGISNFQFPISKQILNSKPKKEKIYNLKPITYGLFPAICLIVSGGHTQLILMKGFNKYGLVGETLDDAAGEAFDKIARILGLDYPGGPAIAKEATKVENANHLQINKLPRPIINSKNLDFSFSGLKTAVLYMVRDLSKNTPLLRVRSAIAAEAQQAIIDVLISKTIRAAEKYKVKSIVLSGGVSANKLLRAELEKRAKEKGLKFFRPEMEYTTDNAAMIALAGFWNWKNKKTQRNWKTLEVDANLTISG